MKAMPYLKTFAFNMFAKFNNGACQKIEKQGGKLVKITAIPIRAGGFLTSKRGSSRGAVTQVNNSAGIGTITVPSLTTFYSYDVLLKYGQAFGIWLQAGNGSGTANMLIEMEQSYKAPTTQGASDSSWVVADGVAPIYSSLKDTLAHIKQIFPAPMKHLRLKITGLGSNPADATLTAWIFQQELVA